MPMYIPGVGPGTPEPPDLDPQPDKIMGAYVQAWVWVDLSEEGEPSAESAALTDEQIIDLARIEYERDGEIEIDCDATVSRSEE